MKRAIAYQRRGQLFLHASSKTKAGVWILSPPVLTCSMEDTSRLAGCVAETLSGSNEGVPHPSSWKGLFDPVLRLAGVKSWKIFVNSAKCVEIELDAERVSFIPTKNLGVDD